MVAPVVHNQYSEDAMHGVHDHDNDTFKVMLSNTAPTAANSVKANLTEISAGNGYPAGGEEVPVVSSGQTDGNYKQVISDATITADGGTIGPFRYATLYNDTPTSPADPLCQTWDYGESITLQDGESFVVDFSADNGVIQVNHPA